MLSQVVLTQRIAPGGKNAAGGPVQYDNSSDSGWEIYTLHSSQGETNKARMSVLLNRMPTTLLVDSGASVNVLPIHVFEKVNPSGSRPQATSTRIYPYQFYITYICSCKHAINHEIYHLYIYIYIMFYTIKIKMVY